MIREPGIRRRDGIWGSIKCCDAPIGKGEADSSSNHSERRERRGALQSGRATLGTA